MQSKNIAHFASVIALRQIIRRSKYQIEFLLDNGMSSAECPALRAQSVPTRQTMMTWPITYWRYLIVTKANMYSTYAICDSGMLIFK